MGETGEVGKGHRPTFLGDFAAFAGARASRRAKCPKSSYQCPNSALVYLDRVAIFLAMQVADTPAHDRLNFKGLHSHNGRMIRGRLYTCSSYRFGLLMRFT